MPWIRIGIACSLVSAVLLAAGPLGTRTGLWTFVVGFVMLALSLLLGLVGAGLSLVGGIRTAHWSFALIGIVIGLAVVAVPSRIILMASGAPAIHDITTDTGDPPLFVAALPLRASAANPPEYGGADVAEQQRRAFPDIKPLVLAINETEAFQRALGVVHDLGWEVVGQDRAAGRIESVDTTFWFGFKDDIVIRIRGTKDGARVDVRSKSRVGLGDTGTNARRVRSCLNRLKGSA